MMTSSTESGEQMRPGYDLWRARYPHIFTKSIEIRQDGSPDPSSPDYQRYHIESGVELTGQPWCRVQKGYKGQFGTGIEGWQMTHEFMGHILLGLLRLRFPELIVEEHFWSARFGGCQYKVMPASWKLAKQEPNAVKGVWADQPVEIWAEAARLCFDSTGPGDRSMNWGCELNVIDMRMFFRSLIGAPSSVPDPIPVPPQPEGGKMEIIQGIRVIDVRDQLPFAPQFVPFPSHDLKTSNTIHWTGGSDTIVSDEEALLAIIRWAHQHINTDWSPEGGFQGGAGIMYSEVIAPSGTVFLTRDPDAHTWHCSDPFGNKHSRPILVICDQDDYPTNQQLASLDSRITFPEFRPHGLPGGWVSTQCPGPQLREFLDERRVDDMFTAQDREDLRRVKAHLDAEGPRQWTQRLQDWWSKAAKSIPEYARPTDFSGPDVTTNKPRT